MFILFGYLVNNVIGLYKHNKEDERSSIGESQGTITRKAHMRNFDKFLSY